MSKQVIIKIVDIVAVLASVHIIFFGFTGIGFWAPLSRNELGTPDAVGMARFMILAIGHIAAIVAPFFVRDVLE
jgi:hypothetical protein